MASLVVALHREHGFNMQVALGHGFSPGGAVCQHASAGLFRDGWPCDVLAIGRRCCQARGCASFAASTGERLPSLALRYGGPVIFFGPNLAGRACTTSGLELAFWNVVQLDGCAVVLVTNLHRFQGSSGEQEGSLGSEEPNSAISIYVKKIGGLGCVPSTLHISTNQSQNEMWKSRTRHASAVARVLSGH